MEGATQSFDDRILSVAIDAFLRKGKHLSNIEREDLENFISNGLKRETDFSRLEKAERDLQSKILDYATANMSLRDFFEKICPLDPFC